TDLRTAEITGKRCMSPMIGIEGALAYQPVDAGFGSQQAKGIVAFHAQGNRLDTGHVAIGDLEDFRLEALVFGVAKVLAQQNGCPVLGFGTAGSCLDVDRSEER